MGGRHEKGQTEGVLKAYFKMQHFLCYWRMTSLVLQTEKYEILAATNMRIMAYSDTL